MANRGTHLGTAAAWVLAAAAAAAPGAPQEAPPAPPSPAPAVAAEAEGPRPLTLEEAITLALQGNFDIQATGDRVQGARLSEWASRAQFHPQVLPRYRRDQDASAFSVEASQRVPWTGASVSAAAGYVHLGDDQGPFNQTSSLALTLSQPLLKGFGRTAATYDLVNARRAREDSERERELSRQRLAVEVARRFFDVQQQRQLLDVSAQSLERSRSLQRSSEARLQVGLASKLDVYRAQLQAAQAEDGMVRSRSSLESALEQFRSLLGLPPTAAVEPAEVALPQPGEEELEPVATLVARALARRLDLRESRDQVLDARRSESVARQGLLPQLDLTVGMTQLGRAASWNEAWRSTDRQYLLGFVTSYPLQRASEASASAQATLNRTGRERTLRQRELEVETEVRAAVRELERLRQSVSLQQQAVEVAEQQRRLAQLRYERGLASNFDVVDAEGSLVLARSALAGLLASYQVARLDLQRVTGTLALPEGAPE